MNNFPITSKFQSLESFRNHAHNGIDFGFPRDSPLYSIEEGVVSKVLTVEDKSGLGNAIFIKLQNGNELIFAHLNKIFVREGDILQVNDPIGLSGNSGRVFGENGGYHLHLALKDENGQWLNPEAYVLLIQNIGNNVSQLASTKLDAGEMLRRALESVSDPTLNFINQLHDIHIVSQALHTVSLWIT